jgi:hypothetical protein
VISEPPPHSLKERTRQDKAAGIRAIFRVIKRIATKTLQTKIFLNILQE